MKKITYILSFFISAWLLTSCLDDLNQYPHAETTSSNVYTTAENYKAVLGKLYTSFVTTGQEKGGGNADLSSNSGQDYMRCFFNLQECGTDEVASTWLSGDKVTDLTYLSWDANDPWGSTTYIICGAVSNGSDLQIPGDYGVTSGWGMFRVRGDIPAKFVENDGRALFFTEGQTQDLDKLDDQKNGYFIEKWTNLTDAGETASNTVDGGVNTDYPMFRLADVYLMLAEAVVRGGTGSSRAIALDRINELRQRAFGDNSGNIEESEMSKEFILDERARELYWECSRRTDLIRYGMFVTGEYLWQWKGGTKEGKTVDSKYNIYPIPATELTANPNLYNENY